MTHSHRAHSPLMLRHGPYHVWQPDVCLVTKLGQYLAALPAAELAQTVCVLPTQRLSVNVLAELAQTTPACIPPRCLSLDQLIDETISPVDQHSGEDAPQSLDPISCEILLGTMLRDRPAGPIGPGHEHELTTLFAAVDETGLGSVILERIADVIRQDVYRSEGFADSVVQRAHEIVALYTDFQTHLVRSGFTTPDGASRARVERFCTSIRTSVPWQNIIVCGFTTMKGYYVDALRAIAEQPGSQLWFSEPPDLLGSMNPVRRLLISLETSIGQVKQTGTKKRKTQVQVYQCPSQYHEVAHALTLAQEFTAAGLAPNQIGILVTNEGEYAPMFRTLLSGFELETNVAASTPLSATELGIWLSHWLRLVCEGESLADFSSWLTHRATRNALIEAEVFPDQEDLWLFDQLLWADGMGAVGLASLQARLRDDRAVLSLQRIRDILKPWLDKRSPRRSLETWVEELVMMLKGFFRQEHESTDHEQSTTTQGLGQLLGAIRQASQIHQAPIERQRFLTILRDHLPKAQTRAVGYPLRGVQILSLQESRYIPFEAVIIVGCTEGRFPKALPNDVLVDDWLKERIGLQGWRYVEALEDTTFHLLWNRIPHLVMTYPQRDTSMSSVRSRFIERLVAKEEAVELPPTDSPTLIRLLSQVSQNTDSHEPKPPPKGAYEAARTPFFAAASATSLQELLTCPYRFLLSKLAMNKLELGPSDDRSLEGRLLHAVLEGFFSGYAMGMKVGEPLATHLKCKDICRYFVDRLNAITDQVLGQDHRRPLIAHLTNFAWPRFAQFVCTMFHAVDETSWMASFSTIHQEFVLGQLTDAAHLPSPVVGSIDLLVQFEWGFLLVDYKRHFVSSALEVAKAEAPQLVLYAAALQELTNGCQPSLPSQQGVCGYWSILEGKWHPRGVGSQARQLATDLGWVKRDTRDLSNQVDQLLGRWGSAHQSHAIEDRPFAPRTGRHCELCDYHSVCRAHDRVTSHAGVSS